MLSKNEILQKRYRIVRQLGYGGMGAVYEAIDERFGEPIALKEIHIESINERQKKIHINAFEHEAKALAKARHEAIPYVRDYFSEFNRQFLVMELVEGDDLGKMLENKGKPFPLEDVLQWIDQLLDALDYLHNLNPSIIHRDIKPQNLKLSFRRKIKLLDFGIAKSGDLNSTTNNQTFIGATLNYSPIEQILRVIDPTFQAFIILKHEEKAKNILNQNTDVRADIYSVGATFYHLLTNQPPIESTKRTIEIWEGKNDPLSNPSVLNSAIPIHISDWLLKAMEIERKDRFSSVIEMQEVLHNVINEQKDFTEDVGKTLEAINFLQTIESKNLITHQKEEDENVSIIIKKRAFIPEVEAKPPLESALPTQSSPLQPSNKLSVSTQSNNELSLAETLENHYFETNISENPSISEVTGIPYFNPDLLEKKEDPFKTLLFEEEDVVISKKNKIANILWILPIIFLGVLAITGIVWMNSPNSTNVIEPVSNKIVSTTPETPKNSENTSLDASPTPTGKESQTQTSSPAIEKDPKIQNPVKKTTTKKPARTKPTKNPNDCIFTNGC